MDTAASQKPTDVPSLLERQLRDIVRGIPYRDTTVAHLPKTSTSGGWVYENPSSTDGSVSILHTLSAAANRDLTRDALFRYCLHRAAEEIHGPYERHRRPISFETCASVLHAPVGTELERLDPLVEDRSTPTEESDTVQDPPVAETQTRSPIITAAEEPPSPPRRSRTGPEGILNLYDMRHNKGFTVHLSH